MQWYTRYSAEVCFSINKCYTDDIIITDDMFTEDIMSIKKRTDDNNSMNI